jgi:hypothetical protein
VGLKGDKIMENLFTLDELGYMAIPTSAVYEKVSYQEALIQTEKIMRRVFAMNDSTYLEEDDLLDFAKERDMKFDKNGNVMC